MENILEKIAESTRRRVEAAKKSVSAEEMKEAALGSPKLGYTFEKALKSRISRLYASARKRRRRKASLPQISRT